MASYLIVASIGPVQDFIAQARRTRDLWAGSRILSDLASACAKALADAGATLIFPASVEADSVPNKILASMKSDTDEAVAAAVSGAREAMLRTWRQMAVEVYARHGGLIVGGASGERLWRDQIESFLQFAAVWSQEGPEGFEATRSMLDRALTARKTLREFRPFDHQIEGAAKSSLDGVRQDVLRPEGPESSRLRAQFRIAERERLDAIGLIKRTRSRDAQFRSVTDVALAPWIHVARKADPDAWSALEVLRKRHDLDAQVVVRGRELQVAREVHPRVRDSHNRWVDTSEATSLGNEIRQAVRAVYARARMREPHPYVACLVADGDNMGGALARLKKPDEQLKFSKCLLEFARDARALINETFHGSLVYAGGDDVLAFVSVPNALACAEALQRSFKAALRDGAPNLSDAELPTLSVGIGIGHMLEGMGQLLNLGRAAERIAKADAHSPGQSRNALAVLIDKRSGAAVHHRAQWPSFPVARLDADVALFERGFPLGRVHEVAAMLRRIGARTDDQGLVALEEVFRGEATRILARTLLEKEPVRPATVGLQLDESVHTNIATWVDRMLVASTLYDAKHALTPRAERSR